jgi:hypothetical protein
MKTRETLDPDVERLLGDYMRQRGVTFKEALNDAVRARLGELKARRVRRFVRKTYSLGPIRNSN